MVELPKYLNEDSETVVDRYIELHTPENYRKRRKRLEKHARGVDDLIDKEIGDENLMEADPEKRMEKASNVIKSLAKEWYKSMGINDEDITDNMVETYVRDIAPNETYASVVKSIADNEADFDTNREGGYLSKLKQHLAQAKDDEGLEAQKLIRTLQSDHRHYDTLRKKISSLLPEDRDLSAAAGPDDVLREHQTYMQRELSQGPKQKTYYQQNKDAA